MTAVATSHRTSTLFVTGLLAVALSACEPGIQGSPREVAELTAAALASGDFTQAPMVDGLPADASAERETAYAGLGEAPLTVQVVNVRKDDELPRAEGTLRLTWDLPGEGEDLTLESPMRMKVSEGVWALSWEHALLGVPRGQRLEARTLPAGRADILARDGDPLVTARPVWRFGIDKTKVEPSDVGTSAKALAKAAGLDPEGYAESVEQAGEQAFVDLITYRTGDREAMELRGKIQDVQGAVALEEERVLGPTRSFAQPLLGTVGPVTAEMVEKDPDRYAAGDVAGLTGLSAAFDDQLTGTPGLRVVTVDATTGLRQDTLLERPVGEGTPLTTTLDPGLQRIAEQSLADTEPPSALVAMDHATGEVLAMANGPGSKGADTALSAQYAPGSTFKLASALVLVRRGITPDSRVRCDPHLVVDGYRFNNVPGYPDDALGDIPLSTAMAHSCNTALINLRDQVPMDELASAASDLGIGAVWGMPVTAFSGSLPAEADSDTEHAASLIGQGRVLASPTAMAALASSIAQGRIVLPKVIDGQQAPSPDSSLTPQEAAQLRTLMRSVVTEGGASMLADNPGPEVYAKSGTAEFGSEDPPRTHVWMIAIQGDLAVAVFVEEGDFGSTTAGPIMDAFLTAAAQEDRD